MFAPMSDADRRAHKRVTIAGDLRGEVLVYLISDNNFSAEQRTLLMMFELLE